MTIVQPKLLVIGDYCIDETIVVELGKQNPENNSPLYNTLSVKTDIGMSGNVLECLKKLGLTNTDYLQSASPPIKKTRIYSYSGIPVCRIDKDVEQDAIILENVDVSQYDCVVISDYNKGAVNNQLINKLLKSCKGPIFLDTKKKNLKDFEGCIIKINELEFNAATSIPKQNLIVTLGSRGCVYNEKNYTAVKVPVVDVCGAGDAFLAGLVYGWLRHKDIEKSIKYGLTNATISVQYLGCYRPSEKELLENI